jgi:hypothetical protein
VALKVVMAKRRGDGVEKTAGITTGGLGCIWEDTVGGGEDLSAACIIEDVGTWDEKDGNTDGPKGGHGEVIKLIGSDGLM